MTLSVRSPLRRTMGSAQTLMTMTRSKTRTKIWRHGGDGAGCAQIDARGGDRESDRCGDRWCAWWRTYCESGGLNDGCGPGVGAGGRRADYGSGDAEIWRLS